MNVLAEIVGDSPGIRRLREQLEQILTRAATRAAIQWKQNLREQIGIDWPSSPVTARFRCQSATEAIGHSKDRLGVRFQLAGTALQASEQIVHVVVERSALPPDTPPAFAPPPSRLPPRAVGRIRA